MVINLFDPISPPGHRDYVCGMVNVCLEVAEAEIYLYGLDIFPTLHSSKKINVHRLKARKPNNRLEGIVTHYQFLKQAQDKQDFCLFLSFDNIAMLIACIFRWNRNRINVICHNNLQRAQSSKLSKWSLRLLKFFNIKVIVLEELFASYLSAQLHYKPQDVAVLKAPMLAFLRDAVPKFDNSKCVISYVSGAYYKKGHDVFLKAVEYYLKNFQQPDDQVEIRVMLGKKIDYLALGIDEELLLSSQVKIYSDFISDHDYEELVLSSSYICLPFRSEFDHTISNVFFEALIYRRSLIVSSIELFNFYHKMYGPVGEVFDSEDYRALAQIFKQLAQSRVKKDYSGVNKMLRAYAPEEVKKDLKKILQTVDEI